MSRIRSLLAIVVCTGSFAGHANAQTDYTWTAQGAGNWSVGTNWLGGVAPPFGGDPLGTFIFQGSGSPAVTAFTATNDSGSAQFNVIRFESNLTGAGGFTVNSAALNSLVASGANAEIRQAGLGLATFGTGTFTLNNNLRVGGVAGAANAFGLGGITFSGVVDVGNNTLTVGNGASGNAPTANTRIITFGGQNSFAGGGVVLDGGNIGLAGTAAANSGLGGAGGTFTVTANGGRLQTSVAITSFALSTFQLNGELQLIGTTGMTMSSATVLNGAGALTLRNTSATALTIQSDSSGYTGVVTTDISQLPNQSGSAGILILNGTNGALTGVTTFNLRAGGGLTLSSNLAASTVNNNRVNDAAAINLRNGNLTLQGSVSAATTNTETVGAVTGAGYSVVTATPGGGNGFTALTAASLTRLERGTFLFRGTALGSAGSGTVGNILFTAAPTGLVGGGGGPLSTNISILPYAIGDTSGTGTASTATGSFVTYDANGIRPLTIGEFQANSFGGTDQNVRLTAATANAGSATINSLLIATGGSVTGAGTLNITSGAILNQNSTSTIANNVAFGSAEGVIFTPANANIAGALTGTNGLTKSGVGNLTLSGNNTGLTGTLTLNGGQLIVGNVNAIAGSGQIVVNGFGGGSTNSGITYNGAAAANLTRDLATNGGFTTLRSTGGGVFTLSGNITGAGGIYIDASGNTVELTGNNTYTGPTRIFFGNLRINSDANLGNGGALDMGSSTTEGVILTGNWTTSRHINYSFGTLLNTQANSAVWNGVVTGTAAMVKAGTGSFTINSANPFTGAVTVNANGGEIRLAQNGGLLSTSYTVNSGGSLVLDNGTLPVNVAPAANVVTNRIADTSTVTLANGGTLRLIANAGSAVLERLGNVTITGANNILEINAAGGLSASLSIANLTATGGSVLVRSNNLGQAGTGGRVFLTLFNGAAVSGGQFLANVNAEDLNNLGVIESAVYDATFGIRLVNAGDFLNGTAIQNAAPTNTPMTANFRVNPSVANPVLVIDTDNTINSLRFAPNGVVDYTDFLPSTLTITSGSILTEAGGSGAFINNSSGGLTITSGATPMSFVTNANLNVATGLSGTGGVRKLGAGTLTLTGTYGNTGQLTLSGGVLAATGAALNINNALAVPSIVYQGGTTTAAIEFTNSATATVATFNGSATIANDFRLTLSSVISTFTNGANENQTTTLTGVISGGNATGTLRFSGPGSDASTFVLTNANNSFTGTISIFEGVLAATSNGALGNAANAIALNTTTTTSGGLRLDGDFTGGNALARNLSFLDANAVNTNGNNVDVTGVVSSSGAFAKIGAGTLILSNNANTHTGLVNVNAGRLLVNGNIATGTNAVTVASGAILGGTGLINRPVVVSSGGTLAAGASIGTLTIGNDVTLNGNSAIGGWDIELNGVPTNTLATAAGAPDVDILALTGLNSDLNLVSSAGAPLRINLTALAGTFDYGSPVSYVIATANAGSNFLSNGAAFTFDPSAYTFNPTNFMAGGFVLSVDGNRFVMSFNPINPVPEPGVFALIALATVGGFGWRRIKRSAVPIA